jgi:threonylcarbamoyladenosine tRNA methylthiotransferase MtaB
MKVHLKMVGCRLNQSEIDRMARQFEAQGHDIVHDDASADHVVINTCAVTHDATRTSRQLISRAHRDNPSAAIHVTGCYAHIAPDEIAVLPGVARVVSNLDKDQLVPLVTGEAIPVFDLEPLQRDGAAGRTRAFIKVQDGCDNACTFCVTTLARGAGRSRPPVEIVAEVRMLHAAGYQEAVLTGVHLGSYGHDLGDRDGLRRLVRALLDDTDLPRLRLSSLEPWDLTPDFFDLWSNPRLMPHLHLPLQSGCDATLRRMARRTTQADFRALVEAARAHIPQVNLTTDVIVGFPGETDEEFEASFTFIESLAFSGLHIFRYSKRPGTAAARMRGHVGEAVKKARSARLHNLARDLEGQYARQFVGTTASVLWEQVGGATPDGFINVGYTEQYLRTRAVHPRVLTHHITSARLDSYDAESGQMHVSPLLEQGAGGV